VAVILRIVGIARRFLFFYQPAGARGRASGPSHSRALELLLMIYPHADIRP